MEWNQKETCDKINTNLKKPKVIWDVEVTDTYGGEANYSWVRRHVIEVPEGVSPVRAAKAAAHWTGDATRNTGDGDTYVLEHKTCCQIMFITGRYE